MRIRALVFTGLAVVSSVVAVVGLSAVVASYEEKIEDASEPEDSVYVVVAARDLYQGVMVEDSDLYAVQFPASELPDGVFLTPEHVVGRVPVRRILANEFVRAERLARPELGLGLNAILPRGMRALSIDLDGGHALRGSLEPGSYVDVLVTIAPEDDRSEPETSTLLQAIYVLGVNSRMSGETHDEALSMRGQQKPAVTLLVSAEEAEMVAHARQTGEVRLVLRSGGDVEVQPDLNGVRCGLRECEVERTYQVPVAEVAPDCTEVKRVEGDRSWTQRIRADGTPCE